MKKLVKNGAAILAKFLHEGGEDRGARATESFCTLEKQGTDLRL